MRWMGWDGLPRGRGVEAVSTVSLGSLPQGHCLRVRATGSRRPVGAMGKGNVMLMVVVMLLVLLLLFAQFETRAWRRALAHLTSPRKGRPICLSAHGGSVSILSRQSDGGLHRARRVPETNWSTAQRPHVQSSTRPLVHFLTLPIPASPLAPVHRLSDGQPVDTPNVVSRGAILNSRGRADDPAAASDWLF